MFPVVPDNEAEAYRMATGQEPPQNVTEAAPVAPAAPAPFPPVAPAPAATEPATDIFTVPEPAPAKPVVPEPVAPATASSFTHYVHLADGRVLRADLSKITETIGDRYYENRGSASESSTVIIGVYPR